MNCLINILLLLDIKKVLWYCMLLERSEFMQRKLLTNGNAFKRTDGRWGGVVWYMDEQGERKRKSFSSTTKQAVNRKMTEYIVNCVTMNKDEAEYYLIYYCQMMLY